MAKFLNKKEQVIDFKFTTYGKHLLSVGKFKPVYYAFFDDNVLYDGQYAGVTGSRNSTDNGHARIKQGTQYMEGLVLFENVEEEAKVVDEHGEEVDPNAERITYHFAADIIPMRTSPRKDNLKFTSMIGDALFDGPRQTAPAWKLVMLDGEISASTQEDIINDIMIPQIDIDLNYTKTVEEYTLDLDPDLLGDLIDQAGPFSDGKMITLRSDDALVYLEEVNTQLLTENFDIEVFEVLKNYDTAVPPNEVTSSFRRKLFKKENPQIVDGFMVSPQPVSTDNQTLTTSSVEYYFSLLRDSQIQPKIACRAAEEYNKSSYYIDLDFDCEATELESVYGDIYSHVTEPEICQD